MSEWISVEDRLPTIDEFVLLLVYWPKTSSHAIGYLHIDGNYRIGRHIIEDVTHWQPLPPPPENNTPNG